MIRMKSFLESFMALNLFFLFFLLPISAFSQDKIIPVVVDGDEINYLQDQGKVSAKGNVKMKYKEVELYCDEAEYDVNNNLAYVKGEVKIVREGSTIFGRDVIYDFNNFNAQMQDVRVEDPPLYGGARGSVKQGKDSYTLEGASLTTCDLAEPHYRLIAKKVTVYPGDKVVAKNVILKVGKVPVFYIPFFSQSLKDKAFQFEIYPGKNKEWGYYLLTRWRYTLNDQNKGKLFIDWYDKRGLGLGIAHKMETKKFGEAVIQYYRLEDDLYDLFNRKEFFDIYPDRRSIPDKRLEDDRYKGQFFYSWNPNPRLSIKSEYHKFSDEFFMKDFFEREYNIEPHPKTYTLINYSMDKSSVSLLAQKKVNPFWSDLEYLPQLEYNFYRQNIGNSNFYFQSKDLFSNLKMNYARAENDDTLRFHTHNVLSYQNNIKWLEINPYVGPYVTYYSKRPGADLGDVWRVTPAFGTTLSTKIFKYVNMGWSMFGERIDKIRHVITPEVQYSYRHKPTASDEDIFQFDEYDRRSRGEAVTFTLKNKLQAKNEETGEIWDLVYFSPAVEYTIHPEGKGSHFTSVIADMELYPTKNISLAADTLYDVPTQKFLEVNADLKFRGKFKVMENGEEVEREKYSFALGHRYLRDDSSLGTLDFEYRLSPKLQFRSYLRYEYTTDDIERQQYAFRQDLHCWWMDLGLDIDRHQRGGKDLTFWVAFTLKAFPDISFDFDQTYKGAKTRY
ncbi:MAG: LPS-assembly protein LptD [Candidatus Omnitrophica bacterium]|nr:LPS-assembly protein LptD [Candidatus Omnitrophota bacterium]